MYARFRSRPSFYKDRPRLLPAYGIQANRMKQLDIKPELRKKHPADQTIDMRDKQRLELLEAMRHPRERDFYQDHTYHNQWIARELESGQKMQLAGRYRFMTPGFVIEPWVWFPGDLVEVTTGESRGQRGAIIAVVKYKNEIVVQNINVQDVVLPATETRPEQVVQREHPISVTKVRHVDPETNEPCDVRLVTVKNKETGALEEKRVSLSSGVLMPIPPREEVIDVGDPLKDTPYQDAAEPTYDAEAELTVLTERKLRAMEDHFVRRLQTSYTFHYPLSAKNEQDMRKFQMDVVERATASAVEALYASLDPEWWQEEIGPAVAEIQAAAAERDAAASGVADEEEEEDEEDDGQEVDDDDEETDDDDILSNTSNVRSDEGASASEAPKSK